MQYMAAKSYARGFALHKDGKWAKGTISLQREDGGWGWFHSLSRSSNSKITTEQALRRLEGLGFTIGDECIRKAVAYMDLCLTGEKELPDRKEKVHDWGVFTSLMLAAWIRRFTNENPNANDIADKWARIVSNAFKSGGYDHGEYVSAYHDVLGVKPRGARLVDFANFYPVSLLNDCLDPQTEKAMMKHILSLDGGIYYVYGERIGVPPESFESLKASRYLAAVELLSRYRHARHMLGFVVDWLNDNRNENGKWDMGKTVNDKIYFPISDNWRKKETREADCTGRIEKLINGISG